jgi:hypothetical protein
VLSGEGRTKSGEYIPDQTRQVDFISNPSSNGLGVTAQSVAMREAVKQCGRYYQHPTT